MLSTLLLNSTCFAGEEKQERLRRRIGVTVVSLDCHLLHLAGVLQAQGETLREGASGNPTGVTEKGLKVSLLAIRIILWFLLFEDV